MEKELWSDCKRVVFFGLPLSFTKYRLTTNRLFVNTGFLTQREDEVRLYRITDVSLSRTLMQRVFGLSTIHCNSSDKTLGNFDIININSNIDIKKELESKLQAVEKSINEQMKKTRNLINLYDEKVISMNQFKLENETISNTLDSLMKNKEILEDKIKNIPQETGSFKKDVESVLKIPIEQWNNSMLKTIIKKIYVNNDGTINIQWIIEG